MPHIDVSELMSRATGLEATGALYYPVNWGKLIIFATVGYDQDPVNPLEDCDGMGHIHSFNTRHNNFLKLNADSKEEAIEELKADYDDHVILGYFEHGNCDWHISGNKPAGTEGDYQWDGESFAGIWVPDDALKTEAEELEGDARAAKMREWASRACRAYTTYCNGQVYEYQVWAYTARFEGEEMYDELSDYRMTDPLAEDSLCGIYDDDDGYLQGQVNDSITTCLKAAKAKLTAKDIT